MQNNFYFRLCNVISPFISGSTSARLSHSCLLSCCYCLSEATLLRLPQCWCPKIQIFEPSNYKTCCMLIRVCHHFIKMGMLFLWLGTFQDRKMKINSFINYFVLRLNHPEHFSAKVGTNIIIKFSFIIIAESVLKNVKQCKKLDLKGFNEKLSKNQIDKMRSVPGSISAMTKSLLVHHFADFFLV